MASLRSEAVITRPADEVWKTVSDAATIHEWFPLIITSAVAGDQRTVVLANGAQVEETFTLDPQLRRFQYRIVGGDVPVDDHLGTIDVIAIPHGCVVVYSTEVLPDEIAPIIGPAVADAVRTLATRLS